ncbi:MAG: hypothetical protein VKK59_05950 [Vampirovibrionales bacterium]|nr:hypothetical protein [Vampirovibrionales bacterium]
MALISRVATDPTTASNMATLRQLFNGSTALNPVKEKRNHSFGGLGIGLTPEEVGATLFGFQEGFAKTSSNLYNPFTGHARC